MGVWKQINGFLRGTGELVGNSAKSTKHFVANSARNTGYFVADTSKALFTKGKSVVVVVLFASALFFLKGSLGGTSGDVGSGSPSRVPSNPNAPRTVTLVDQETQAVETVESAIVSTSSSTVRSRRRNRRDNEAEMSDEEFFEFGRSIHSRASKRLREIDAILADRTRLSHPGTSLASSAGQVIADTAEYNRLLAKREELASLLASESDARTPFNTGMLAASAADVMPIVSLEGESEASAQATSAVSEASLMPTTSLAPPSEDLALPVQTTSTVASSLSSESTQAQTVQMAEPALSTPSGSNLPSQPPASIQDSGTSSSTTGPVPEVFTASPGVTDITSHEPPKPS